MHVILVVPSHVAEHYVPGVLRAAKVQKLQVVEMRDRLFATKSEDDGLMLSDKTIPYANIRSISHFNSRRIANCVPEFEAFCILIGDSTGNTTLLYDRITQKSLDWATPSQA